LAMKRALEAHDLRTSGSHHIAVPAIRQDCVGAPHRQHEWTRCRNRLRRNVIEGRCRWGGARARRPSRV
jgi:hypothetical protein